MERRHHGHGAACPQHVEQQAAHQAPGAVAHGQQAHQAHRHGDVGPGLKRYLVGRPYESQPDAACQEHPSGIRPERRGGQHALRVAIGACLRGLAPSGRSFGPGQGRGLGARRPAQREGGHDHHQRQSGGQHDVGLPPAQGGEQPGSHGSQHQRGRAVAQKQRARGQPLPCRGTRPRSRPWWPCRPCPRCSRPNRRRPHTEAKGCPAA